MTTRLPIHEFVQSRLHKSATRNLCNCQLHNWTIVIRIDFRRTFPSCQLEKVQAFEEYL